jgi:hypothetical protein
MLASVIAASPTFGFGVGQHLDGYLLRPSLFTMRIVAGDKYVISPSLKLEYSQSDDDATDTEDSGIELGLGVNIHRAIWKSEADGLYGILGVEAVYESMSYEYNPGPRSIPCIPLRRLNRSII